MRKLRALLGAGIVLAAVSFSAPVSAASYLFQLTGSRDATFTIDTTMTPSFKSSSAFGDQISFTNVAGSFGGGTAPATIGFGNGLFAELNILGTPQGFTQFAGPDFFAIVSGAPTFQTGSYNLFGLVSGSSTLTISNAGATAAVPEPASWAMFIGGFGLLGATIRRRKTAVSFT